MADVTTGYTYMCLHLYNTYYFWHQQSDTVRGLQILPRNVYVK